MSDLMILWLGLGGVLTILNMTVAIAGGSMFIAKAISQNEDFLEEVGIGYLLQLAQYLMFLWLMVTIVILFIIVL